MYCMCRESCSLQDHPGCVQILMAVVDYKTQLHRPRTVSLPPPAWSALVTARSPLVTARSPLQGVCSTWLASLQPSDLAGSRPLVPVWVMPGTFSFPRQPDVPVIMIGPGTGCAPFRAYLRERSAQRASGELPSFPIPSQTMSSLGAGNMLFFGCRSASADFFFHCEWSGMVEAGLLTLHTAFSRDQTQKVLLTVPEHEVYRLSLCVYVCVCVCVCMSRCMCSTA